MNRRLVVISLGIAALIGGAFFLWTPAPKAALPQAQERQAQEQPKRIPAPPQVVYSALFHHVVAVKDQAEAEERQGKDASSLRSLFRERADLSEVQAHLLSAIAVDCVREVAAQDARAQVIISAFKARFPPGRLPSGVKLPPPPPELKQMQQEREAIVLRARDRLRLSFGEAGFQRFEEFVTRRVASGIEPTALLPRSSGRTLAIEADLSSVITTEGGR
jgi:hypothetical protein